MVFLDFYVLMVFLPASLLLSHPILVSPEDDRPSPSYTRERRNALAMPGLGQIPEESTISANDHLVPPVTAEKKGLMAPRIVRSAVNMSNGDCHGAIVNGLIRASTYPLDPRNGCFNSPYGELGLLDNILSGLSELVAKSCE